MSAASLKPCPFCGGETVDLSYADGLWRAECDGCGVSTPGQTDYEEVFRLWNGREVTDAMKDVRRVCDAYAEVTSDAYHDYYDADVYVIYDIREND